MKIEIETKATIYGLFWALSVLLAILKVTGVIQLSWWVVTLPVTGPIGLLLIVAAFGLIAWLIENHISYKNY